MKVGKRVFKFSKKECLGNINLQTALINNCDEYFYKQSLNIGIDNLSTHFTNFGFGEKTNIQLKKEFKGTNPNKEWKLKKFNKPWYAGETMMTSVGKGFFIVTPMQISRYISSMALEKKIDLNILKDNGLNKSTDFNYNKTQFKFIKDYMYNNCNDTSGRMTKYLDSSFKIAGIESHSKDKKNNTYSWFTSYAPFDNPKYSVTILLENEKDDFYKSIGDIVNKIYFKLENIK